MTLVFVKVVARVQLAASRLVVELRHAGPVMTLDVRSFVDPSQEFLLPVPAAPAIDGIATFTRLGRMHSLDWGLAYGAGTLPADTVITFSSNSLRFRQTATARPTQLGEYCWVADAEGLFTTAATVNAGVETARVALADAW